MEEVTLELILNWDQTGMKMVPCSMWTMEQQGAKRVEVIGVNDKRQITAVFCGSLVGDLLPVQVIYKRKTPCSPSIGLVNSLCSSTLNISFCLIMDNFIADSIHNLLECLLPLNTTDCLQPWTHISRVYSSIIKLVTTGVCDHHSTGTALSTQSLYIPLLRCC